MDSSDGDDGHASRGDEDDENEDEDNENNEFVDDIVVDDDMDDDDVNDNLTVTARGIVTGCRIFGGQIQKQRIRTNRILRAPDDIETDDEDPLQCSTCQKRFSHETNLKQHCCIGITGKRDLVHYAMSYAHERIDQHDCEIINMRDQGSESLVDRVPTTIPGMHFHAGWAQTPGHGRMYGTKYIEPFKEDIAEMFQTGFHDKSARMGAGRMLEKLRQKYPGRLDLPPESEIRQAITTLLSKQKRGGRMTLSSNRGIAEPFYSTVISIFNESDGQVKPAEAWKLFQEKHPSPSDATSPENNYPSMQKVKSKISALKAAKKKKT
jgi:hypothetical protein